MNLLKNFGILMFFSAIFMQITFYFSIYTEIDFDHVHFWL